jgi:hypothetical protein
LNSTVGLKKYNADIELLSGVSQWKTYYYRINGSLNYPIAKE